MKSSHPQGNAPAAAQIADAVKNAPNIPKIILASRETV